ncbi:MAG: AI-2E family transporter, partial [Muribaculaceae bacterium]|nr:AI-2E family transporter [Muribaculaceae bacterium]
TGFSLVGLPLAIPMGLLVGLLYMIPYFQYITLVPVAMICFIYSLGGDVEFVTLMGKSILVYVVSQCICDYVITPHVMGREMGLNPAVILLSLSVWGSLLGIIGMIIALPATALIIAYYQKYISNPE